MIYYATLNKYMQMGNGPSSIDYISLLIDMLFRGSPSTIDIDFSTTTKRYHKQNQSSLYCIE